MARIIQYIHRPNMTELGMGNTHDRYLVGPEETLKQFFPLGVSVEVFDVSSKKTYKLYSKYENNEFRIKLLGDICDDYQLEPGDEIVFTQYESKNDVKTTLQIIECGRVFLNPGKRENGIIKDFEIVNIEKLPHFNKDTKYSCDYTFKGERHKIEITFLETRKKRTDSPLLTDFYSVRYDEKELENKNNPIYYLTIRNNKVILKNLPKYEYIVLLNEDGDKKGVSDKSLQQIFYGAPGTGKSHKIKEQTQGDDTVIRTTFHPDSDYSTFVGCYKPTKESTSTLSLHKLHSIYPDFKSKASDRPLHRFIAKYHDSFRLLTAKEAELVFDKYETPSTISAEIPKIMSAIEEIPSTQTITYSFVKQAFTKAYVQAWEKMCRTTPSATPTATIPAGSATSPYSRTGKLGANSTFEYVPQGATLSEDERGKLLEVDNFDFPFEGIDNFAELHNSGITVVVTDKPQEDDERYHKKIKFTAKDIRKLYALWESDKKRYWFLVEQGLLRKIYDKLIEEKKLKEDSGEILVTDPLVKLKDYTGESVTIEINESNTLLGKYVSNTKTVYLYKENIGIWGHGEELELLCAVYVHEMFHAYFDRVPHQTISEIEEPIVECCTLCFLELFDNAICNDYLNHVRRKQQSSAICYYGFGAFLYENRSLDWMKLYQNGFGKIIEDSPIVEQYKNKFFPAYRFAEEQSTMDILYSILNPQSKAVFGKSDQFLIIEEINRGNCAQIFGDLFQLLDRNEYGYSEYPIVPDDDLKNVLAEDFAGLTLGADVKSRIDAIFKENYPAGITDKILSGELLVLPENLYIWATMNTSDQSLFPIDSAFKRRWDWKYMPIGYKNTNWIIEIGGKEYEWVKFQRNINEKIYEVDSSEDKQLGDFFVNADRTGGVISADTLLNKILFYLWNDVCKDDPDQIFRWIDDKKEVKSIKFSEFFKDDKEKKLQGFMAFHKVPEKGESSKAKDSEEIDETGETEREEGSIEEITE